MSSTFIEERTSLLDLDIGGSGALTARTPVGTEGRQYVSLVRCARLACMAIDVRSPPRVKRDSGQHVWPKPIHSLRRRGRLNQNRQALLRARIRANVVAVRLQRCAQTVQVFLHHGGRVAPLLEYVRPAIRGDKHRREHDRDYLDRPWPRAPYPRREWAQQFLSQLEPAGHPNRSISSPRRKIGKPRRAESGTGGTSFIRRSRCSSDETMKKQRCQK